MAHPEIASEKTTRPQPAAFARFEIAKAHVSGRNPERIAQELLERFGHASPAPYADLVIALASEESCTERALAMLYEGLGRTPMIGCSASDLVVDGEEAGTGIAVVTLRSPDVAFRTFSVFDLDADPEGHADDVVESIRETCAAPAAVLVFAHAFSAGIDTFARRIGRTLPRETALAGGLAFGDPAVGRTYQVHNERLMTRGCSILVIDGPARAASAVTHGMVGLGRTAVVTDANRRRIRTIDGEPAAELYRRHLGNRLMELPAIGQTYPLGVGRSGEPLRIRSVLHVDWDDGSLVVSGPVETGAGVRVMLAQKATLARETMAAADRVRGRWGEGEINLALVFGQGGRRALYSGNGRSEAGLIRDRLAPVHHMLGFSPLGAIGRDGLVGSAVTVFAI